MDVHPSSKVNITKQIQLDITVIILSQGPSLQSEFALTLPTQSQTKIDALSNKVPNIKNSRSLLIKASSQSF